MRARLARWGLLEAGAPQSAVRDRLGIDVAKFDFRQSSAPHAVEAFAHDHGADLMVLGTRGLTGFDRWLEGSMAERIADRLRVRTLFVSGHARGFVDSETGAMRLSRILFPVDSTPDPEPAYGELEDWLRELDVSTRAVRAVHAGATPPRLRHGLAREQLKVEQIAGPAVEGIVDAAADADLIVMPTQGRQGFLDLLRGSTTQRVLRRAPCPVLAIPEAGDRSRDDDD